MRLYMKRLSWLPWLLLAVAILATVAAYWPGLAGGWVFDDYPNIVDNRAIHITPGHAGLVAWVNAAISSPASFLHRPLASITFALNWMMGSGDPWPFKFTNVIIHLINGVLLFCMLRSLLRLMTLRGTELLPAPSGREWREAPGEGSGLAKIFRKIRVPALAHLAEVDELKSSIDDAAATRFALVVSAAWLLLPINLMAVLYVVQRMESLCQVFVLAGLWAYLHGRWMMLTANDARQDRRGFALAIAGIVAGTLLGLTSKETAVLLPVFAFLAEWILLRFRSVERLPSRSGSGAEGEGMAPAQHPRLNEPAPSRPPAQPPLSEVEGKPGVDKRIWTLFTVALFVPAVLGFLWLLRAALRPSALAGRDFTLSQRLLTEPRVLVDYLH